MTKIRSSAQFKSYQPGQILLLPPSFDELIEEHDLVRVVNQVVDSLDISELINRYKGGGTTAYHPRMLLKILRGIEIESCFGDIKHNMGFRRFHLRGIKKVETEFSLVAMAHNLRKLQIKQQKKAA